MKNLKYISLVLVFFVTVLLFPFSVKRINANSEVIEEKVFLEIWHLDMFEGGTGSRQNFLYKVSQKFQSSYKNVFISINVHTKESCEIMFSKGVFPDIISFSNGLEGYEQNLIKNNLKIDFNGIFNKSSYVYPWASGGYILFTKKGEKPENLIVSKGRFTNPLVAYYLGEKRFENMQILNSLNAYNKFITSKNTALLGTQRDIFRLKNKNVDCDMELVSNFSDIIQYVAITCDKYNKISYVNEFVKFLCRQPNEELNKIGLFSLQDSRENLSDDLKVFSGLKIEKTINIFTDYEIIKNLQHFIEDSSKNEEEKLNEIKKIVK